MEQIGHVVIILILAVFISRPLCICCPLGAFYSLFTRGTLVHLDFVEEQLWNAACCMRKCPIGVKPQQEFDSHECIMCLKCLDACQFQAGQFGTAGPRQRSEPPRLSGPGKKKA